MTGYLTLTFALLGAALAKSDDFLNVCNNPLINIPLAKEFGLIESPNFFFKVSPDGHYLGWISESGNHLLNTQTNQDYAFPGPYDVVFSPDQKMICTPETSDKNMVCFSMDEAITEFEVDSAPKTLKKKYAWAFNLPSSSYRMKGKNIRGVYQTIGHLQGNDYRIITDNKGLTIHEVEVLPKRHAVKVNSVEEPCQEGLDGESFSPARVSLPMLSKDGQYLAYLDSNTQTTRIIQLNDKSCHLVVDLGYPTGKVDFDFQNNQIAFHITEYDPMAVESYFMYQDNNISQDVFVLKVERQGQGNQEVWRPESISRVTNTHSKGRGSYYPSFDQEGNLYFLNRGPDKSDYWITRVNSEHLNFYDYSAFDLTQTNTPCPGVIPAPLITQVIGDLFQMACLAETPLTPMERQFMSLSLGPEHCKDLVQNAYEFGVMKLYQENPEQYASLFGPNAQFLDELTLDDLLYFCEHGKAQGKVRHHPTPATMPDSHLIIEPIVSSNIDEVTASNDVQFSEPISNQQLLSSKCLGCHNNSIESIGLPSLKSPETLTKDQKQRVSKAIQSNRMPMGAPLSNEEKKQLLLLFK